MFSFKYIFSKCEEICRYLRICSHLLRKYLKETSLFMQCPYQQNFFVFRIRLKKKSQLQKIMFLRDFDFYFGMYLCSFLTHFYASWSQNVIHTYTNLKLSAAGLFQYAFPFVSTWHDRVKNSSNMIFSALRTFLMVIWSESRRRPVPNV